MITNAYPSVILEDEDYDSKASINGRRCTPMLGGPGYVCLWMPAFSPPPATGNHLAAASALSSGRVLKAIAAPGAAL
jgi:hypothetical protein